jgi:hypothetical protein
MHVGITWTVSPLSNAPTSPYLRQWRVLSLSLEASILVAYLFERELALRLAVA